MNYLSSEELVHAEAAQKNILPAEIAEKSQPERRYKRGYDTQHLSADVRQILKDAEACHPFARMREALLTVASIPAIGFATVLAVLSIFNSGLSEGDVVVISGVFLLAAESRIRSATDYWEAADEVQ